MMPALRCRNVRQIISNPNLAFIRQFADEKEKTEDPKTVASRILQNNYSQLKNKEEKLPEDPHIIAEHIITDYPEEPTSCCMSGCANCVWLDYAEKLAAYYKDGGERAMLEINERVTDGNLKAFILHELRIAAKKGE